MDHIKLAKDSLMSTENLYGLKIKPWNENWSVSIWSFWSLNLSSVLKWIQVDILYGIKTVNDFIYKANQFMVKW